ncbi:coproporphyrinogen III oxidase, anaerobic [Bacteroidales bacterium WCE2004]|nr:coproporphyrinogen III oxidase, anaerobic [Bacteroidales bacterium WCE2004]
MVYLHVPFCRSFCTYCDFYSEIACRGRDAQSFELYAQALCAEASRRQDEIAATRDLNTLYVGGGTPSVLHPALLRRMLAPLMTGGDPFTEFTIEVNPEDIVEKGVDYVRELLALGVNRVSMGVQSLDDGILRWMNRRHDAARARQAFGILREAGVRNISIDLIFGISQLSEAIFAETLCEVLAWRPEHVSAYQLSIEGGSALAELVRQGRYSEAPQEQCAAQYRQLCDALRAAGYIHYEISNWALPGREAVHNSAYWSRHPYVGLGPAAHSFDGHTRSWNPSSILAYAATASENRSHPRLRKREGPADAVSGRGPAQQDVFGGSSPLRQDCEYLSAEEAREEEIMLGLRTARGVADGRIDAAKAAAALSDGRLERAGDRLRIPEDRWFVSDDIIADLV